MKTGLSSKKWSVTVSLLMGIVCHSLFSSAQIFPTFETSLTPEQLVKDVLIGPGVEAKNVKYKGADLQRGSFIDNSLIPTLDIKGGVILTSGSVYNAPNLSTVFASSGNGSAGDIDLNKILKNNNSTDASVLEFDFIPSTDTVQFRYIFASEEYPEYVGSQYNDIFAFLVSGPGIVGKKNIAIVPGTADFVSINNVNDGKNATYYRDNSGATIRVVYDGLTTVMTAWIKVIPCQVYHMKLAVSDVGDQAYDTSVLLEAGSFISVNSVYIAAAVPTKDSLVVEGCTDATIKFIRSGDLTNPMILHYDIGGSAQNGIDYQLILDSVVIPAGQTEASIEIIPVADGISEPVEYMYVKFKDNFFTCFTDSIGIKLKDPSPLSASANDTSVCRGDSALLTAVGLGGSGVYTYAWNTGDTTESIWVSPLSLTTYNVTVSDFCGGLSANASSTVTVFDLPVANAGSDITICKGDMVQFNATGGLAYEWWPSLNMDDNTVANPQVYPEFTTTYLVKVTNANGCSSYDSLRVTVNDPLARPLLNCEPSTLSSAGFNWKQVSNASSYLVSIDNGVTWNAPSSGTSSADTTHTVNYLMPEQPVTLLVQAVGFAPCGNSPVSDPLTCYALGCDLINVTTSGDTVIEKGKTAQVSATTTGGSGSYNYTWTPDIGNGPGPYTVEPEVSTTYYVTVSDQDAPDCPDASESVYVQVDNPVIYVPDTFFFNIPNAFSPNEDGMNDEFRGYGMNIKDYKLSVFNRWGEKVFESNILEEAWKGTVNGRKSPAGAYIYIVSLKNPEGKAKTITGVFSLTE